MIKTKTATKISQRRSSQIKKNNFFLETLFAGINDRLRFVICTFFLTCIVFALTLFCFDLKSLIIVFPVLLVSSYLIIYIAILKNITGFEWFTLFVVPIIFTLVLYVFYIFNFQVRHITRIPFLIIYSIGIYALLLVSNIFNVGVEKNIQLYRAAFSINFLFQTLILYFFITIILKFNFIFIINSFVILLLVFLMAIQLLWTVQLKDSISKTNFLFSVLISIFASEIATAICFLPIKSEVFALVVSGSYYGFAGLFHHYADQRLFKQTIQEFSIVFIFVLLFILLTMKW